MAASLVGRFERTTEDTDITRATQLWQEVLSLRPLGHIEHADALTGLAYALCYGLASRISVSNVLDESSKIIGLFREASTDVHARVLDRLSVALQWSKMAALLSDDSAMEAQAQTLLLLDNFVAQSYSMEQQYLSLLRNPDVQEARQVAVDAAASAIARGRSELAVRLLEQGRNVVFRQLGQLRTQLDDIRVVVPTLERRFTGLRAKLERLSMRSSASYQTTSMEPSRLTEGAEYRAAK